MSLLLIPALAPGQETAPSLDVSSTDDITVADGLQLPGYGVMWALDTWKGIRELIQLDRPETSCHGISLRLVRNIELKGEAAKIRIHDSEPQLFLHGVTGDGNVLRASFVIVRLDVVGNCRQSGIAPSRDLSAKARARKAPPGDVVDLVQERVGLSDWYRLSTKRPLAPGEYAVVPVPGDAIAVSDGIRDFAIDPEAPENAHVLRSEKNRGLEDPDNRE